MARAVYCQISVSFPVVAIRENLLEFPPLLFKQHYLFPIIAIREALPFRSQRSAKGDSFLL